MAAKGKKTDEPTSHKVTVFVPRGQVREGDIKKAALLAARDKIPVGALGIELAIGEVSDVKTVDGTEGRDYAITITYTPRRTTDNPEGASGVDQVLAGLEPLTPEKMEAAGSSEK